MYDHDFKFRYSYTYIFLMIIASLVSFYLVMMLPISLLLKGCLLMVGGLYLYWVTHHHVLLRASDAILRIQYCGKQEWVLYTHRSVPIKASLRGDSTVTPWVSILRFQCDGRFWPISCIVFRDALKKRQYRALLSIIYR